MAETKAIVTQGFEQFEEQLKKLSLYVERDLMRGACKAGAEVVEAEAKDLAPRRTGALRNAIRIRAGKSRDGGISMLLSIGKKYFQGEQFYGAFQEFGWLSGKRKGGTNKKGEPYKRNKVEGYHFMEYAFEEKKQAALDAMVAYVKRGLQ